MYYINVKNVLIIEIILWIRVITQLFFIYLHPIINYMYYVRKFETQKIH